MRDFQQALGLLLASLLLLAGSTPAHARMALIVGEPFGSFGTMMPQGHASIYLEDECVETPVQLRPCRPGEYGSVVSRYHDLRHPAMDWMAFPLPVFLYGTEDPKDSSRIPASMTPGREAGLRELYRQQYLSELVPDLPDRHGNLRPPPYGDWEEGIGAAFDRRLLVYEIDTTPAQDAAMLAWLNDRPNLRSYTLGRANCADFAADLLGFVLPAGTLHRNVLADFDMTTPKTLARQIDAYGRSHPELHPAVYEVPQLRGSLRRSRPIRGAAQSLLTNHYYLATLLVLQPEIILADAIVYEKTGKFKIGTDAQAISPAGWHAAPQTAEATPEGYPNTPEGYPDTPAAGTPER